MIEYMSTSVISVGQVIEVQTERLAYGGEAVAHHEGLAVFIPFAAPGESLLVRVTELKKNFARAVVETILVPSSVRREPPCTYFGDCGGCQLQHITYAAQLSAKLTFVTDALHRVGHITWPREIEIRSANELGYRTRAQIKTAARGAPTPTDASHSVSESDKDIEVPTDLGPPEAAGPNVESILKSNRGLAIGFNRAASHTVCDVTSCPILVPELNSALGILRSAMSERLPTPSANDYPAEFELAAGNDRVSCEPALPGLSSVPVKQPVGGIDYRFGPRTFFQANRFLLEDLVNTALENEAGKNESGRLALDLYAGAGLFSARLGRQFDRVMAVESDRETAALGRRNMTSTKLQNVEFFNQRAEVWLKRFLKSSLRTKQPRPNLVILDPPRAGASAIVNDLLSMLPPRITYVSCDPVTLSRDLSRLSRSYRIKDIVCFDLFPQTYHVETIAKLEVIGRTE
jgi:23S rRNA (uracil1939-C5)-methyltransferase